MKAMLRGAIAIFALLAAYDAAAQTLGDFEALEGRCPTQEQLSSIPGPRSAVAQGIFLGYSFVLRETPQIGVNSAPSSELLPRQVQKPAVFERVVILGQHNASRPNHRLLIGWGDLQTGRAARCGWIAREDLLRVPNEVLRRGIGGQMARGPRPMLSNELRSGARDRLTVRAVLNNLEAAGEVIYAYKDPTKAPASSDATPAPAQVSDTLQLHEFFSVFARASGQPRRQAGAGDATTEYLLLGRYGGAENPTRIVGWVHANDIYYWNSRSAVYWAPGGAGKAYARRDSNGVPRQPPFMTAPERLPEQTTFNIQRFPVIDSMPDPNEIWELAKELPHDQRNDDIRLSQLVRNYRVAIPFEAVSRDGQRFTAQEQEAEVNRRADQLRRAAVVDVLFLIDATSSMDAYFAATATAVRDFIQRELMPRGLPQSVSLQIGVAIYRDYTGNVAHSDGVFFEWLVQPFLAHNGPSAKEMQNLGTYRIPPGNDVHDDALEAPFAAIIRAVQQGRWRQGAEGSGLRFLVHLADHGNREENQPSPYPRPNPRVPNPIVERIGVDQVVRALLPPAVGEPGIQYYPIMVEGRPDSTQEARDARAAFERQSQEILRRRWPNNPELHGLFRRTTPSPNVRETEAQRREAVLQVLMRTQGFSSFIGNLAEIYDRCARNAGLPECRTHAAPATQPASMQIMPSIAVEAAAIAAELNITPEAASRIASRRQNVAALFVRPIEMMPNGRQVQTLTYWVALDQDGLGAMQQAMERLCSFFRETRSGRNVGDPGSEFRAVLRRVATGLQTGPEEFLSQQEPLGVLLSIPFWERQRILSDTEDEFAETFLRARSDDPGIARPAAVELDRYRRSFCASAGLLAEVQAGKRPRVPLSQLSLDENYNLNIEVEQWERFRWDTVTGFSERIFFVPYEYLPSDQSIRVQTAPAPRRGSPAVPVSPR